MTDTMAIWDSVSKTDPAQTKHVSQRGGFTAINANYQIMNATKQFGPLGVGWGYDAGLPIFHDNLLFVPVTLWHGERSNTFGPMTGCEEWKSSKGHIDSDASKKATTDALTKLLSQLGFNADVFLGKYDDQKYVAELKKEFAEKVDQSPELTALIAELHQVTDLSECKPFLDSKKDIRAKLLEHDSIAFNTAYTQHKANLKPKEVDEPISDQQAAILQIRTLSEVAKVAIADIFKKYSVMALSELTLDQANDCIDALKAKIEKEKS